MINKKKTLIIVIPVILLLVFGTAVISNFMSSDNGAGVTGGENIRINFSEEYLDDNQLIDKADNIIVGKISSIKEKSRKVVSTTSTENKEVKIELPYIIYNVDVEESLKSTDSKKSIELVLVDSTNEALEIGQSYLLYTTSNKNGTFVPLSYSRGILKADKDKSEFVNEKVKEKFDYNELKKKILERVK